MWIFKDCRSSLEKLSLESSLNFCFLCLRCFCFPQKIQKKIMERTQRASAASSHLSTLFETGSPCHYISQKTWSLRVWRFSCVYLPFPTAHEVCWCLHYWGWLSYRFNGSQARSPGLHGKCLLPQAISPFSLPPTLCSDHTLQSVQLVPALS